MKCFYFMKPCLTKSINFPYSLLIQIYYFYYGTFFPRDVASYSSEDDEVG